MNINYLDNHTHSDLKDSFTLIGFHQLITKATRITKDCETLIEIILSSRIENVCSPETVISSLSDHDIIGVKRKLNNIKMSDIIVQCRDCSKYDPKKMNDELSTVD